jgi:hypothetical protein
MKNKKLIYSAIAVIGVGAYLIYSYFSKNKKGQSYTESVKEDVQGAIGSVKQTILPLASYPLKNGSKGSNVIVLQKWLNDKGYASPKLVTDGIFGAKTENGVKLMQETPFEKAIADYNSKAIWTTDYKSGQITKDFYDKFIK